ncbi:MAG TPA: hypothetical protein VHL98_19145 [Microvirga sp.]|jgi:hypothetical protein|nr:hypothetical protein [Microvirga sp.]
MVVFALVALALAMVAGGAWALVEGYGIIVLERGWALVIAGATTASLGLVLLGIAAAVARLGRIRRELVALREHMARPEPNFPEPPGRVDPVLAVSSGLLAGGGAEPAPVPAAPVPPAPAPAAPLPDLDPRSDDARRARREEAAQRRGRRAERETAPLSAGTIAAGAAAAVAAGAVVSAGISAMRGREEAGADQPASGDSAPALRSLDNPIPEGPVGDELLPDRDLGPAGAGAAPVTWPVVPAKAAGAEPPAFPAGAESTPEAPAPEPVLAPSGEEDAPFATREPVVPDTPPAGAPSAEAEDPAVLGTYNSGGNRYVMFADGSIEAETPDGSFRFGSLDELKAFIAAGGERPRES